MELSDIKTICGVGAGAMGAGTALCFAIAGYDVQLYDLTETALDAGLTSMRAMLDDFQQHGLVAAEAIPGILARVTATTSLKDAAAEADFVIESIVEVLAVKQKVFGELDALCPPRTIFATNTSGLSPTAIAAAIDRRDKFVVCHFWNPPQLIPLVEVVPGAATAPETVELAYQLMAKIGKQPVRLQRESLGFIGNRIQAAALREALHIVAAGIASAADVDKVVEYSLGRRYAVTGPIKSADLGGLDIFNNIFGYLGPDLASAPGVPAQLAETVAAGKLGAKTGQGIYPWTADELAALRQRRTEELFRHLAQDAADHKKGAR